MEQLHFKIHSLCGIVANVLDYNIVVSEFELQSRYDVRFWTRSLGMNFIIRFQLGIK